MSNHRTNRHMLEIHIHRAEPRDAAELIRITMTSKAHWGYPTAWLEKWASDLWISPDYIEQHLTMKAVRDGRIAGYYSLIAYDEVAWLDNLFILPEFMGKGAGRALFEHALVLCRNLGKTRMEWESDPNAADFYYHMGARHMHDRVRDFGRVLPVFAIDVPAK